MIKNNKPPNKLGGYFVPSTKLQKMKNFILFSLFSFSSFMMVFPQNQNEKTDAYKLNLTAFSDYQNFFFVFDNGVFRKLEHHPVKDFRTGTACIAYIDDADNLKAYYQGSVYNLSMRKPKEYMTLGKMVVFVHDKVLSLFDDGKTIILSTSASNYFLQDSLLCYYDETESKFMIYQNGRTKDLEGVQVNNIISVTDIKAGDNILAYTFNGNSFKIYFRKQSIVRETTPVESHSAARNIVAYIQNS